VADITHLDADIFDRLWKENVVKDKIHYVTPNFLRLGMYLELSRPRGDVSRWTKVYSRLLLLNKHYPLTCPTEVKGESKELTEEKREAIQTLLEKENVVLLGITASQIHEGKSPKWFAPVTLLAERETIDRLTKDVATESHPGSEILPAHVDILDDDGHVVIRFHETAACHSYHQMANGIKVASIPTMLQFFFAYMFADVNEAELTHLLCVTQRLVDLAAHKESRRYALLTPMDCIGTQETLVDLKRHKSELYTELSKDKTSVEFLKYFFTYNPRDTKTKRERLRKHLRETRKARVQDSY
jgi:hypothetical protein